MASPKTVIGWREWVKLPALGIDFVKAKIDTGARSSALHAFDIHVTSRRGIDIVRFKVHPLQRDTSVTIQAKAEVTDYREVRSSSGHRSLRPVIISPVELSGESWPIELTLVNRDEMGFRMLLSRGAVRGRFIVDPARSFMAGRGPTGRHRSKKTTVGARSARTGIRARKAAPRRSK